MTREISPTRVCTKSSEINSLRVREGTNRSKFFRGEVDKYTWVDIGSSFLPSDILAAYLFAQLESLTEIDEVRQKIYRTYAERLQPLADEGLVELPVIPEECCSNATCSIYSPQTKTSAIG